MNIEEIRLKYQATGDIVEEEMDFLFSEIDLLREEDKRLSALAAQHLADQELLVARERKKVARECAEICDNIASGYGGHASWAADTVT